MSRIRADKYTNRAADGAPTFSDGVNVVGITSVNPGTGTTSMLVTGDLSVISGTIKGSSELSIAGISSSIADTAVDVFVYDTSKDSDGGAWRKRTSQTSWYNETLNTAIRGSRKDFPAVAVIVAEATKVTIYDGDDPDLPMWMEFDAGEQTANGKMLQFWGTATTGVVSSVAMLNGVMVVGTNNGSDLGIYVGMTAVNFASDSATFRRNFSDQYVVMGNIISDRNVIQYGAYALAGGLVGGNVNDLAMTVLPNAPIDDTTGLPIPTIAVATDGGVSVIKDYGNVYDLNIVNRPYSSVDFTSDNLIFAVENPGGVDYDLLRYFAVPSADIDNSNAPSNYGPSSTPPLFPSNTKGNFFNNQTYGSPIGLTRIDHADGTADATSGMVAYAATSYNTGWMQGDIKGAFLSDTSSDADFGPELVTGGNFSDASQWTLGTGWSIVSGQAVHTGSAGFLTQSGSFTGGRYYQMTADLVSGSAGNFGMTNRNEPGVAQPHDQSTLVDVYCVGNTGNGKIYAVWQQRSGVNLTTINLYANAGLTVDNVSIKEITKMHFDRSANNRSLILLGSINKTAVNTGTDLVSYSGFSSSNNLLQPYNSGLNFGTGDFSFIAWIKKATLSTNHYILDRNDGFTETDRFAFIINDSGTMSIYSGSSTAQNVTASNTFVGSAYWRMVMVKREDGKITFGLDGKEYASTASVAGWDTTNITGSGDENLFLGQFGGGGGPGNVNYSVDYAMDQIANVRILASAPSTKQFKKMYEDEKYLYQENAKATLYGSSDAITALAFDDNTNILHVGTSDGRSDFQGLRRINNTTVGITSAISASNDLVAEQ